MVDEVTLETRNEVNNDLFLSAAAIVDAAIACQEAKGHEVSPELRPTLIQAIIDDPLLTAAIFKNPTCLIQ